MKNRLILGIWLWAALAGPPPLWPQAPEQGQAEDRELADFFLEATEGAQPETPPAQPAAVAPTPALPPASPPAAKSADPFALPPTPAAPEDKTSSPFISGPVSPPAGSPWIQLEIGQGDQPAAKLPSLPPAAGPDVPAVPTSIPSVPPEPAPEPEPEPAPTGWKPSQQERLRSVFSDMLPPESSASPALPPAPPPAPPSAPPPPATPREDEGASAILKSGGLISVEDYVGAAEILPPLTGRLPLPKTAAPQAELPPNVTPAPSTRPRAETRAPAPAPQPSVAPPPPKPAGGQTKNKKRRAASTPDRPAAGVSLTIINETGQPRIGEQYRSVLTQMGYRVLSVGNGPASGGSGQTVIKYRPGSRAGALAVSRHLPGRKVLVEAGAGQVLASEIMVHLK